MATITKYVPHGTRVGSLVEHNGELYAVASVFEYYSNDGLGWLCRAELIEYAEHCVRYHRDDEYKQSCGGRDGRDWHSIDACDYSENDSCAYMR